MKVRMVVVGRVKGALGEVVRDYEARVKRYWTLEVAEVEAGGPGRKASPAEVRSAEEKRIVKHLPDRGRIVLMSRKGKGVTSRGLARLLQDASVGAEPEICFVIGGAHGVSRGIARRSHRALALSDATLTHEMARLVLVEQIYRAGTILRNEPYHKGGS